jgi:hypothetical protein
MVTGCVEGATVAGCAPQPAMPSAMLSASVKAKSLWIVRMIFSFSTFGNWIDQNHKTISFVFSPPAFQDNL